MRRPCTPHLAIPLRMTDASGMESESEIPPCAVCGKPAAVVINGVAWCEDCFQEMGSCCGEWHEEEP